MAYQYQIYAAKALIPLTSLLLVLRGSAFETATHSALSIFAAGSHYQSQVNEFLTVQLMESKGLLSTGFIDANPEVTPPEGRISVSYLDALGRGSEDEDSPEKSIIDKTDLVRRHRVVNHFYDPVHNGVGLNDETALIDFLHNNNLGLLTLRANPQIDSLHWAWDNREAVPGPRGDENYSWQAARREYALWLKSTSAYTRSWHAGETFYALGHVIHLVQDLAQPQHTRNDAHLPVTAAIGGDDGSLFEDYCLQHYRTPAQIAALPIVGTPIFTVLREMQADGIPPELRAFWDTGQLNGGNNQIPAGVKNLDGLGLAEFSNSFFVTADTLFSGEPALQPFTYGTSVYEIMSPALGKHHQFPYPRLKDVFNLGQIIPKMRARVTFERGGEMGPLQEILFPSIAEDLGRYSPWVPSYCSGLNDATPNLFVTLTDDNYKSHARVLLPKAVAYSTGMLNYFFRGRLKMEFLCPDGSGDPQLKITNLTTNEPLGEGTFTVLREDPATSNRTDFIPPIVVNGHYPGLDTTELAFGQSFTNSLPSNLPRDGNLILVFKGTIGSEKDIAIAAVVGPGLCDRIELLANGANRIAVEFGDEITFTRKLINLDGTCKSLPLTENSWYSTANTGYDFSDKFRITSSDGKLQAMRRGVWKLQPRDGGCVTVEVKSDGVTVWNQTGVYDYDKVPRTIECSIDGVSLGSFPANGRGNDLYRTIYQTQITPPIYTMRLPLRPGSTLVLRNATPAAGPASGAIEFYGGVTAINGRAGVILYVGDAPSNPLTITVPSVPGDPPPLP
jgi:hypothetical protein